MTPVSPIETQLRKVIPELCVNDVLGEGSRSGNVEFKSCEGVIPLPD